MDQKVIAVIRNIDDITEEEQMKHIERVSGGGDIMFIRPKLKPSDIYEEKVIPLWMQIINHASHIRGMIIMYNSKVIHSEESIVISILRSGVSKGVPIMIMYE